MKRSIITLAVTIALTACNDDSNSTPISTPTPSTPSPSQTSKTGHFIDEAVKGLFYKTATESGCTDENGAYLYKEGETISFALGKCDGNNNPISSDDGKIVIGESDGLTTVTPYNLKISEGADAGQPRRANDVARILKSFTLRDAPGRLDLSGVTFTDGTDNQILEKVKKVVNASVGNSVRFDDELKSTEFTKLQNFNSSITFLQTELVSEADAKKQLSDVVGALPSQFTSEDLVGNNILLNDDYMIAFAGGGKGKAYELKDSKLNTIDTDWEINSDKNLVITLNEPSSSSPITVSLVSKNAKVLSVYNNNENQGESWKAPVKLTNNSTLSGTYKSNRHTFTITINGTQISYKDEETNGETVTFSGPYSVDNNGHYKINVPLMDQLLTIAAYDASATEIAVLLTDSASKGDMLEFARK